MLKHYIEVFYPGIIQSKSQTHRVADRTPPVKSPPGACGYRFFSRTEVTQDGETLLGPPKDHSPMTYYGEAMTLEQVKALRGGYRILLSNMEINGQHRVVHTIGGQFFPLNPGDLVQAIGGS